MTLVAFPTSGTLRQHATLPIRELAEKLADAEDIGLRRALAEVDDITRMRHLVEMAESWETRVHLYEAQLRLP